MIFAKDESKDKKREVMEGIMFKKNQIVYAKSQDYGKCIIQLVYKITKNIKGGKLKSPIWYAYILDTNKDRNLIEFLFKSKNYEQYVGFFEDYDKDNFMCQIDKQKGTDGGNDGSQI